MPSKLDSKSRRQVTRRELETPLTPLEDALATVRSATPRLPARRIPLDEALGCALAEDTHAKRDVPGYRNSAMDGFAVVAADLAGASGDSPVRRPCVGEVVAGPGKPPKMSAGTCVKIFTGAPVPEGADAVVPVEDVSVSKSSVKFAEPAEAGRHVRGASDSLKKGDVLLGAGSVLGGASLGLLASAGYSRVSVTPRARVVVVSTGDEVVEPGGRLAYGQVYDSNGVMIASLARRFGAAAVERTHVEDDPTVLRRTIARLARKFDLLIFTGGVSVGERDWVRDSLEKVLVWRVAIKPGKPFTYALLRDGTPVVGLPGNPGAAACSFAVFGPAILSLMSGQAEPKRLRARLAQAVEGDRKRLSLVRVSLRRDKSGRLVARRSGRQESAVLSSFTGTHALALVPAGGLGRGRVVEVVRFPEANDDNWL
ncbi:MAG: molybdopterin molybdenumtransferase MoeA [Acidobacteria bacterium]|nr:MAG: molybdopterin molybdenumtransferase MoeA [Acidobacteriota bacterium]